jgi:hypothetical protein
MRFFIFAAGSPTICHLSNGGCKLLTSPQTSSFQGLSADEAANVEINPN